MNELKVLRKKQNLTQIEMANTLKVSSSYYIKIEGGFINPSYNLLKKVKEVYGDKIDLNKLFN